MNITIKNCNNIDEGNISINNSILNIKYGINGIGKTTISKAIDFSINDKPNDLLKLKPFKLQKNNPNNLKPEVLGLDDFKTVLIFNEEYLEQFLFKPEELISNSFDILVRTPDYEEGFEKIKIILEEIKKIFIESEDLNNMIESLDKLSKSFKLTQTSLSKSSDAYKSFENGNKIENIPEELMSYKSFLKSGEEICISWLDWHSKGINFLNISENCPYCSYLLNDERKNQIKIIGEMYDKNLIKKLSSIIDVIEKLGEYFSLETIKQLKKITTKKEGLTDIDLEYLSSVGKQINLLMDRLKRLQTLTPASFEDIESAEKELKDLIIDIGSLDKLNSKKSQEIIGEINKSLEQTLNQVGLLQGEVNKQKIKLEKIIEKNQKEINQFLEMAGYKYKVIIIKDNNEYKLKLQHLDFDKNITGGKQHLSFGERNAFAITLFMYEVLSKNPDLIILDDPISSFDKNKKYAIMYMLFNGKSSLKNKTVLMLTHDFEPVIDTMKALKKFYVNKVKASFIKTKNGIMDEKQIEFDDIITFTNICKDIILSEVDVIIKLIYLRRYYEVIGNEDSDEYQVLSNIIHGRLKSESTDNRTEEEEEDKKIDEKVHDIGIATVKKEGIDFDYDEIIKKIKDKGEIIKIYNLTKDNYIKINLIRMLLSKKGMEEEDDVFQKFINESYHIENELIFQLSPIEFNPIPEFIIEKCDSIVASFK